MADNLVVTAGTGSTLAADEVADGTLGTVKVGYIKIMDGTIDGTTKAAVGANGLAVDVKAVAGNVAVTEADGANVTLGAKADAKSTATDTTAISAMSVLKQISASVQAPPSQAVTNAGTFAVQAAATEADGANVTLGSKADAKSTATDTTAITAMQVLKQISASVQAPPSQAVTNAGTFAVQATLQANSGVDIGKLTANQSVNVAQINGATPLMGVGATGTGAPRVVEANDAGRTLVSTGGSAASSGNNTLVAAGTNKLKVYAFSLSSTATTAVTCIFQSGAGGTELWRVVLQAATSTNTGANLAVTPPASLFATASATLLNLNLSGAQTVHWSVAYFDEA